MEYLSKITAKKIGIQPRKGTKFPENYNEVLATLFGIARSYSTGQSDFGTYQKFAGDFEATRTGDGETFRSARLILPPIIANQLQTAIDANTDEKSGIQFAVELGIKYSDNAIGYEWTVHPVGKVSANADPLAALREEVQKTLPAPERIKRKAK